MSNMQAELLIKDRIILSENSFAELVLLRLPDPKAGSIHAFKYRLAFVVDGVCVLRYDDEGGKGDHKHIGAIETAYIFESPHRLLADFWHDVDAWRTEYE
jgi:hypothetical protein